MSDSPLSRQSESIGALGGALAKAQGVIEGAKRDRVGQVGNQRTRYADLSSVWDACREALATNDLSVVQIPTSADGVTVTVHTTLIHKSGEWLSGSLTLKPSQQSPQALGSAITYARRYALMAMVGVAPDDDDGAAASNGGGGGMAAVVSVPVPKPPSDPNKPATIF